MSTLYLVISAGGHPGDLDYATLHGVGVLVVPATTASVRRTRKPDSKVPVMLDSGAFSVFSGKRNITKETVLASYKSYPYSEGAALDVIGDPEASMQNYLWSVEQGSDQWPTFHYGEDWSFLEEYRRTAWKIGLGGIARLQYKGAGKERDRWLRECFRRAWPHRFHLFGVISETLLMKMPFHSADSSGWQLSVAAHRSHYRPDGTKADRNLSKGRAEEKEARRARLASVRHRVAAIGVMQSRLSLVWKNAFAEADAVAPARPVPSWREGLHGQ